MNPAGWTNIYLKIPRRLTRRYKALDYEHITLDFLFSPWKIKKKFSPICKRTIEIRMLVTVGRDQTKRSSNDFCQRSRILITVGPDIWKKKTNRCNLERKKGTKVHIFARRHVCLNSRMPPGPADHLLHTWEENANLSLQINSWWRKVANQNFRWQDAINLHLKPLTLLLALSIVCWTVVAVSEVHLRLLNCNCKRQTRSKSESFSSFSTPKQQIQKSGQGWGQNRIWSQQHLREHCPQQQLILKHFEQAKCLNVCGSFRKAFPLGTTDVKTVCLKTPVSSATQK